MKILGIETSCDETSIALLEDGVVLANEVYTQEIHAAYGGVVPEIASRAHLSKIDVLCEAVFRKNALSPGDIDLVAVTDSPGLAGALLVGISFALGLHCGHGIPVTGINHLEGHICSVFLEHPHMRFPLLALVASGGHTSIYRLDDFGVYECLGGTVDDAAGEAFDKIGKLLGFSYPAGRAVEKEAAAARGPLIGFPVARMDPSRLDFSYSGLKTSVKYYLQGKGAAFIEENKPLICESFQRAIIDSLIENVLEAARRTGTGTVALVGGVACNGELRRRMRESFPGEVFCPSPSLCTDNAAMIALAGWERWKRGLVRFPRMAPSARLA